MASRLWMLLSGGMLLHQHHSLRDHPWPGTCYTHLIYLIAITPLHTPLLDSLSKSPLQLPQTLALRAPEPPKRSLDTAFVWHQVFLSVHLTATALYPLPLAQDIVPCNFMLHVFCTVRQTQLPLQTLYMTLACDAATTRMIPCVSAGQMLHSIKHCKELPQKLFLLSTPQCCSVKHPRAASICVGAVFTLHTVVCGTHHKRQDG